MVLHGVTPRKERHNSMVGKNNKRIFITLSDDELELLDKLSILTGATKSNIIKTAIANYVPGQIGLQERYFRKRGLDAYTKQPLSAEDMHKFGLDEYDYPLTPEAREVLENEKKLSSEKVNRQSAE